MKLSSGKDPMGSAIADYYYHQKANKLRVQSSLFEEDEIPVPYLFRTFQEMPLVERQALRLCRGEVLDVGAASGCHSLALCGMGYPHKVTCLELSQLSCDVMKARGLNHVLCMDFFAEEEIGRYDTVLMLMNGTSIIGKLERMPLFFRRLDALLAPGGQVLVDSSDLIYLYDNGDGTYDIDNPNSYYGEVDYRMVYKDVRGERFDCLYLDFDTLRKSASAHGYSCELILQGKHYDYLARIAKAKE
ncbi:MAG: class I SAM-dependent methyltransferase [Bacteroidaceae bacterium]|jgi:precorrin-6B methylase 2|nr:class I SAM-dependent methyltransferase [Bacteroidaceae bacterium]